jgi:transposase
MKAYSEDLRRKVVEAIHRGMGKSEAARSFGVSLSSVKRYVAKANQGDSLTPKKHPGPRPKLDERARKLLEVDVENRPAVSLRERGRFLERVAGIRVSESTPSLGS